MTPAEFNKKLTDLMADAIEDLTVPFVVGTLQYWQYVILKKFADETFEENTGTKAFNE